ncbi:uncharacterized protein LOC110008558 [Amborella trichopoda]|uniref:uncharacterized protein LOC110008558 n=1 Tax=Amborella trichopoda TaxID=13333 RepID=UPI0009C0BC89|nr:uncharacterized protein LOC110008558 [Amborella trichopoda]|eukprot:XP_020532248.1 uncharacterized protein LOC110008558 [Amborella trichopoda]
MLRRMALNNQFPLKIYKRKPRCCRMHVLIAKTHDNYNRHFYKCSNWKNETGCGYLERCNEILGEDRKSVVKRFMSQRSDACVADGVDASSYEKSEVQICCYGP